MHKQLLSLISTGLFLGTLWAQNPDNAVKNTRYLALGDSIAFGYNPLVQPPALSKYVGYPLLVSPVVHEKVANASCPGETTTSLITGGVGLPGFDCGPLRVANQLFVSYNGAASQLDYAVAYLMNNPNPKLVTINIGGNDLGVLQLTCNGDPNCELAGLPATLDKVGQNLTTIFMRLRQTGYTGPIVAVNYFAFNYMDPLQVGALTALNTTIATVAAFFNVRVADAFTAFAIVSAPKLGDACAAGLLIKLPNGTCDTHPTLFGQGVIAASVVVATLPKH